MVTEYRKLVRDRIPDIIRQAGKMPVVEALGPTEFLDALVEKLSEEAQELRRAPEADAIDELVDLLEVLLALADLHGHTLYEVIAHADHKRIERGAFKQRLWLREVAP